MLNNHNAGWLVIGTIAVAIVLGQLAYVSPSGTLPDGLRFVLVAVTIWLRAVFSSLWFLETAKNVAQGFLLGGPAAVQIVNWDLNLDKTVYLRALVAGFLASILFMGWVTRRIEQLRQS